MQRCIYIYIYIYIHIHVSFLSYLYIYICIILVMYVPKNRELVSWHIISSVNAFVTVPTLKLEPHP